MSKISAVVTEIKTHESITVVCFDSYGVNLKMMSLDLAKEVKVGVQVLLNIKASSIALAKKMSGELSYSNKIPATITKVENGVLLSSIRLSTNESSFESVITLESSQRMNLQVGDGVTALLKASELSIAEVLL